MKSTGIVRKLDNLGRIVLPSELRKILNISQKDPLEIFVEGDTIILKKYAPECIFCGGESNVVNYKGKNICSQCILDLKKVEN